MNTLDQIRQQLERVDGLRGIVLFTHLSIHTSHENRATLILRVSVPTIDDAFVLFHVYGRILSRICQSHVDKIDIYSGATNLYYFSPNYRLTFH